MYPYYVGIKRAADADDQLTGVYVLEINSNSVITMPCLEYVKGNLFPPIEKLPTVIQERYKVLGSKGEYYFSAKLRAINSNESNIVTIYTGIIEEEQNTFLMFIKDGDYYYADIA